VPEAVLEPLPVRVTVGVVVMLYGPDAVAVTDADTPVVCVIVAVTEIDAVSDTLGVSLPEGLGVAVGVREPLGLSELLLEAVWLGVLGRAGVRVVRAVPVAVPLALTPRVRLTVIEPLRLGVSEASAVSDDVSLGVPNAVTVPV
jgi:hypothetical protein